MKSKYLGGKPKFTLFARCLYSQSDSSYFEKSCTEIIDLTNLLNFFCCLVLFVEIMNLLEESQ